ncbi:hypothetical protein F5Y19DRAFT_443119 [Xylariaceae sp. FL1651]|nr:hypothetical protein F5Y19DRAFT_443119 [Xylariaceae sp. FL1651]
MQGSHLCHHDKCIAPSHIVCKPSNLNNHRRLCHERVRFLGLEHVDISKHYVVHKPPYILCVRCSLCRSLPILIADHHPACVSYNTRDVSTPVLRAPLRPRSLSPSLRPAYPR